MVCCPNEESLPNCPVALVNKVFFFFNISLSYILYNKNIIVNLYKLRFSSSSFSLQPNKKDFHPPTFPSLQPNTHEGKPNLFYPPTNFPSSYFFTLPTKRTLSVYV